MIMGEVYHRGGNRADMVAFTYSMTADVGTADRTVGIKSGGGRWGIWGPDVWKIGTDFTGLGSYL